MVLLALFLAAPMANAFYMAEAGRWITRDPMHENGGNNLYTFNLNGPTKYIDPFGNTGLSLVTPKPPGGFTLQMPPDMNVPIPPGGGVSGPGGSMGSPSSTGPGNNPTTGPNGCTYAGQKNISSTWPFTCPCSLDSIQCEEGLICQPSPMSFPTAGSTSLIKPLLFWMPYRDCDCPEGSY